VAFLVIYGFPPFLIGAAAGLGVGASAYFLGVIPAKDLPTAAIAIPAGIVIVGAISYAYTGTSDDELVDLYGRSFFKHFWIWSAIAFVLGSVFGLRLS
jgi:hypothetical protein